MGSRIIILVELTRSHAILMHDVDEVLGFPRIPVVYCTVVYVVCCFPSSRKASDVN